MFSFSLRTAILLIFLCSAPGLVAARQARTAETTPTVMVRLSEPIRFDGRVEDSEWGRVPILPVIQFGPTWGAPVQQETELRIAYDDDYFYYSARCFDTQPPTMTTYRRDNWDDRDDQVGISIDSFNDSENAVAFVIYATGARIDAQFSDDARSDGAVNIDWNTFWDGKVHRTEQGWEAEIRIPISSLRFETPDDGPATMGISAYRYRADGGLMYQYPGNEDNWGYWSWIKPSKGARHTLEGISASRALYIAPYVTAGLGQAFELNADGTRYVRSDDPSFDAGLDVKYSITSNLTLDATFNTDFAQVEADDQQVNLTRFSLFFPEKRQFFLERTSNFDFSFGGFDRVFYSRRVGLSDGKEVRLLGGGRIVGRVGAWDVGLLTLQTGREKGLESENFGVLRVKRTVLNANSYLGGITTSRIDENGDYNAAFGVDGIINLRADDFLRFNWAQTYETGAENAVVSADNSRLRLELERARSIGASFKAAVNRAGRDYHPGAGFQLREDYTQVSAGSGYGWRSATETPLQSWTVTGQVSAYYQNETQHWGTVAADLGGTVSFLSQYSLTAKAFLERDNLTQVFALSEDAEIPVDDYRFGYASLELGTPSGNALKTTTTLRAGQFYDGNQRVLSISPKWSVSERISVSGTYEYNRIRFPDRGQSFDAHVVRSRTDLMMNTKVTFSALLQYNSTADAVSMNARFRYNPKDGNDFFLVFNQALNTDRMAAVPQLPVTSNRTLIAKYTYTFLR